MIFRERKHQAIPAESLADLFFELGFMRRIRRSPLKDNTTTIAEHTFRVLAITYFLAKQDPSIDFETVITMALFHDMAETRTGDVDLVQKGYVRIDEQQALGDMFGKWNGKDGILRLQKELYERRTPAAKLVHDADILEELLSEKEQYHRGDARAKHWMEFSATRLLTPIGKRTAREIIRGNPDHWWQNIAVRNFHR